MRKGLRVLTAIALACSVLLAHAGDRGIANAVNVIHAHAGGHRLVLLGEFHGTREIPLLVGDLVARYADEGPVELALEIPHAEQASLDRALAERAPGAARRRLLARDWWNAHDDRHDGRRCHDMLDLIERLRTLRARGHAVTLLAYDAPVDTPPTDRDRRDREMAARIRTDYLAKPATRLLLLGGNVHAMLARPDDAPAALQVPMGSHLRDLDPVSVRIMARSGESWACYAPRQCRPMAADGAHVDSGPMSGEYTYRVVLDRFHVARLVGATKPGVGVVSP